MTENAINENIQQKREDIYLLFHQDQSFEDLELREDEVCSLWLPCTSTIFTTKSEPC